MSIESIKTVINQMEGVKKAVDKPKPNAILKISVLGLLVFCNEAVLLSKESSNVDANKEEEKE